MKVRRDNELAEIKKLYEPGKNRLVGAAIAVLLTGSIAVLSQLEKVAVQLETIWPGASGTTRALLFGLSLIILVGTLLRWLRHTEFQSMLGKVCTTDFARRFLRERDAPYYRRRRTSTRFDEAEVIDFIEAEFSFKKNVKTIKIKFLPEAIRRFLGFAQKLIHNFRR